MDIQFIEMGNRIKHRREEQKIKQAALAETLGISNNHLSSIECGREKPSLDVFVHICDALNVTPDYLLLGNIHANDIPQNIVDKLRLCSKEDVEFAYEIIELLVQRNSKKWNEKYIP